MKNFEKYEQKIKEFKYQVALGIDDNKLYPCRSCCIKCSECRFYSKSRLNSCNENRLKWLYEEYKEPLEPLLTDEEREYLKAVIKPFRDEIEYIMFYKYHIEFFKDNEDWCDVYRNKNMFSKLINDGHKYSLEDLGL